ncbi:MULTISPECIES: GldL-related protein [Olleya]|uniref:Gliding motility protein GldL-like N-terminal domain-containing protein n=1 Tax=Olleya namhaensis TaxID=1144750 RepID=A0A1I3NS86_9FLAO|nr:MULTISPECIES: hypothetical protein [Olleya]PKG51651.1 gliding motility protein GldL [Olleya sp. 1-3]SFJ12052.1 hypothetical protein SAMN05443431_104246 [Olleya namhaensis]
MKLKQLLVPFIILLIGIAVTVVGAVFKIQHWTNGSLILTLGTFIEFCGIFLGIIKLIKIARQ